MPYREEQALRTKWLMGALEEAGGSDNLRGEQLDFQILPTSSRPLNAGPRAAHTLTP